MNIWNCFSLQKCRCALCWLNKAMIHVSWRCCLLVLAFKASRREELEQFTSRMWHLHSNPSCLFPKEWWVCAQVLKRCQLIIYLFFCFFIYAVGCCAPFGGWPKQWIMGILRTNSCSVWIIEQFLRQDALPAVTQEVHLLLRISGQNRWEKWVTGQKRHCCPEHWSDGALL